uniref:Voltage-dependent anion-selective channel protein 1 n=1 Tax=Fibrocapsa japonica TaxID=94617 RepID=A0A7S2Y051_9STRA|mmetsp:Transcript_5477/g.8269  ORF Transcript_5477/g.8269 Transcript_5477/m.8269 type:complete len:288 (+) Transcript_5477:104-967(+)|eukprot:CAMPEP_0113943026 /NCGR_PEP_ID=MMETSP1339-20121228/16574_1 /TAXON_ID=94617 /ORGANISM="Fibrocapsa japonica" /LENGTH=287 /DNA_ID=CAMNT_0000947759 /DNA_START=103 /DNA_END=966 /DNA_ORIENTATION=+ /assembly_acc=CAM_ASM_000762
MAVPLYKDFTKPVKSLFEDDYKFKQVLKTKYKSPAGVGVTIENERSLLKGASSKSVSGKVSASYDFKDLGVKLDKLELSASDVVGLELSSTGIYPGAKLSIKANPMMDLKGNVALQYKCSAATVVVDGKLPDLDSVDVSVTTSQMDILLGGKLVGKSLTGKGGPSCSYDLAVGYNTKDFFAAVSSDKGLSAFKLLGNYTVSPTVKLGAQVDLTPPATAADTMTHKVTMGGTYKCNPTTTVRAKVTSDGVLSGAFQQNCAKTLSVAAAAEMKLQDMKQVKYGFNVTMG